MHHSGWTCGGRTGTRWGVTMPCSTLSYQHLSAHGRLHMHALAPETSNRRAECSPVALSHVVPSRGPGTYLIGRRRASPVPTFSCSPDVP